MLGHLQVLNGCFSKDYFSQPQTSYNLAFPSFANRLTAVGEQNLAQKSELDLHDVSFHVGQ